MKKIDSFINQYPISKTLRFSLIPEGKTEENFNNALILERDKERAREYKKAKKLIDRYHRHFIEMVLCKVHLEGIKSYAELYYKSGKDEKDVEKMEKLEFDMRKLIAKAFSTNELFKFLDKKELIQDVLPKFLTDKEELKTIGLFNDFTTYFTGFHENRKNMYTDAAQSTAIAYRCINDNLPKFLDNALTFEKVKSALSEEDLRCIDEISMKFNKFYAKDIFSLDYFDFVLSQSGIERYNNIIGGYTTEKGEKIQGINEYINLYNQQVAKGDKPKRLPFMKLLHKQILSEGEERASFVLEAFDNDDEVITTLNDYFGESFTQSLSKIELLFNQFADFDLTGIFVQSGYVTEISNAVAGYWGEIAENWKNEYELANPPKKGVITEKYIETRDKLYKNIKSFSVDTLQSLISKPDAGVAEYIKNNVSEKISAISENLKNASELLCKKYSESFDKKLSKNEDAIKTIKDLLDSVKDLERILKALLGTGKEENKCEIFYGEFLPLYDAVSAVDRLYDKVRNYVTKKPYSNDKIKLNFDNPQFLGGWDKNKERDYRTILLKKSGFYYLGIMSKENNKSFIEPPVCNENEGWEKIEYKLLPGPNKMLPKVFFASSNAEIFKPDKKILQIREKESFKKGGNFNIKDCHSLINFFKDSINIHEDWSQFGFEFSPTERYSDISEFYREVEKQGYMVKFKNIPEDYISELVDKGYLYLFRIHNKDFSENSHGKENLHTMYFKMLFDERNLKDVVYQLNGGAEMFYREASIKMKDAVVHKANEPIKNKNENNEKKSSIFSYDIIKDRRYTKHQFSLHLPIKLNFKASGNNYLNNDVRLALKKADKNYVIGIDRGERNLLYICVVDECGKIVEQKSLNEIISDNNYKVDYHKLLDKKEKERDEARKSWGTIENIKELKEGYLSQVVHQICEYVVKYDAIIALEDLNFGFKRGRFKVEKQVYQKFENMLCTKLNYLVRKEENPENPGGLLKAYQLTKKMDGVNRGRQDGIIFYVPAYLTSKIDPVTGFVDLIHPRYVSVNETLEFIEKIDDIRYNEKENIFEFDIDYSKFGKGNGKWTICTNGERIINTKKDNIWKNETIVMTEEFKKLFDDFEIDINGNIKASILKFDDKAFFKRFMDLLKYTLQLRNSEINNVDVDYLISPVKDKNGEFFDSRRGIEGLPENADANGAYNIARKGLWAISVLKDTEDDALKNANLSISNSEWLEYIKE